MHAEKAVNKVSRSYLKFAREMAEAKNRVDASYAYKRGITLGKAEEKLEIARKLKARGCSFTEIAEDTGLSPETIEKL